MDRDSGSGSEMRTGGSLAAHDPQDAVPFDDVQLGGLLGPTPHSLFLPHFCAHLLRACVAGNIVGQFSFGALHAVALASLGLSCVVVT